MPDFNIEVHFHCETDREWSVKVQGKTGVYTVTWDRHSHSNHTVQYDYSCTCAGYKFHKTCSHIKQVIEKQMRCGWSQFSDGGEPVQKDGKFFCPKCGEEAFPLRYAV